VFHIERNLKINQHIMKLCARVNNDTFIDSQWQIPREKPIRGLQVCNR